MKKLLPLLAAAILAFAGCSGAFKEVTLDTSLAERMDKLEDRITKLEELCTGMNEEIASLQKIVSALKECDYITDITPIRKGGKEVGYTITFSMAGPISIYHGNYYGSISGPSDGTEGPAPVIGIRQDEDEVYYWTLDGAWMLDDNGNRIKAEGVTPQLKIENGHWYVSYDGGLSWEDLGIAGATAGDSFFKDVTHDDNYVYLVMEDDSEIRIPKAVSLSITFNSDDLILMEPDSYREIGYTIESSSDDIKIEVISSADIKAKVVAETEKSGYIRISTSDTIDEYSKVVVLVTDGRQVIMRTLTFEEEAIEVSGETEYSVPDNGGNVTLHYLANTECEVIIPQDVTWIRQITSKAILEYEVTLEVDPANGTSRTADIIIRSESGASLTYTITQNADGLYTSTDYSEDGRVIGLQVASEGNGIDVVLMGDGYSDRLIADGTYRQVMEDAMEYLFTEEPYCSFRNMFNVYMVNAVSENEHIGGSTIFSTGFGEGTLVSGNHEKVFEYAGKALTEARMDEAMVVVMLNSNRYAGTCYMYHSSSNAPGDQGSGPSISYFPTGESGEAFSQVLNHETCGHGFAKLADEYAYEEMGHITQDAIDEVNEFNQYGWFKNMDFTSDLSTVKWSRFISDPRYADEGIGVFEGGYTYWTGVWRPTENSIMRYNTGGFNAPSREAIYYRIHKLAYGSSWAYDYEEFVEYDSINRQQAAEGRSAMVSLQNDFEPLAPPVVVGKSWKEI